LSNLPATGQKRNPEIVRFSNQIVGHRAEVVIDRTACSHPGAG